MIKSWLIQLLFFGITCAYVTNYYAVVRLNDQPRLDRHFIIDTTAAQAFVIPSSNFLNHRENYIRSASKTYQKLPGEINEPFRHSDASVDGDLAEDEFHMNNKTFRAQFAIASSLNEMNPAINFHGRWSIGCVGFSKKKVEGSLKDKILEQFEEKSICMSTAPGERVTGDTSYTTIGAPSYIEDAFLTKIIAEDNEDGLWQFPLKSVRLGDFVVFPQKSAILSTATDDIIVPYQYFEILRKTMNATYDTDSRGRYQVKCEGDLDLKIGVNDQIFSIPYTSLVKKRENGKCKLMIKYKRDVDQFILGAPLMVETGICLDFKKDVITFFNSTMV